ncbi:uncharacterized protein LOC112006947 [Quercus suber]|uniref:uncharacterized protein LOC112006947 n=1 Tax=Quercus suber TaxID=58331 RepID=UPI0032E029E3
MASEKFSSTPLTKKRVSGYASDSMEEVELKENESKNHIPVAVADANATKHPAKTLKKKKKTTKTHQPQSQGADKGDDPSTHKSKIIFKGFEARINEQGVQSDFLPKDTVAELVELWKSFKQAEFECSRREAHFSEKLFEAARDIYSSSK